MSYFLLQYLIKSSISLVVLYAFYRIVLRPLTFYQWNRFYLLCYSLFSFVIPFININPLVDRSAVNESRIIDFIPSITNYTGYHIIENNSALHQSSVSLLQQFTLADYLLCCFLMGVVIMLTRFLLQYASVRKIKNSAVLLSEDAGIRLYETARPIGPFSFGNDIYVNRQLHQEEELQRIIQHEIVHVKQRHTADIVVGELLCILNWFNPFAWLIRYAIRQNLEFIADNNVVANGLDRKEYQYLLLKVVGIPQYSITSNFNFSNLKKRIAMMNKIKTTKFHLTKFLFVLPLLAVMLLAFRNKMNRANDSKKVEENIATTIPASLSMTANGMDTVPASATVVPDRTITITELNEKGYNISIVNNTGECVIIVKDKNHKIVKAVTLTDWNKDKKRYEEAYGEPPPPLPPVPAAAPNLPPNVAGLTIYSNIDKKKGTKTYTATVRLKDGSKEIYNLNNKNEKEQYTKKYGEIKEVSSVEELKAITAAAPSNDLSPIRVDDVPLNNAVAEVVDIPNAAYRPEKTTPAVAGSLQPIREALIVIDGVIEPQDFDLNIINPVDIESISVLKNKEAQAKYGDKGKKGVIEIIKKNKFKSIPDKKDSINWKTQSDQPAKNPAYSINNKAASKEDVAKLTASSIDKTEFVSKSNTDKTGVHDGIVNFITKDHKDDATASINNGIVRDLQKEVREGIINNTLYIGVDNILKVEIKGVVSDKIVAKIDDAYGTIAKKDDYFIVRPSRIGVNVIIKIYAQETDGLREVESRVFRTDALPDPSQLTQVAQKDQMVISADSIIFNKNILVLKGKVTVNDKENFADGNIQIRFSGGVENLALVIYNGKEITNMQSFKVTKAKYRLVSLKASEAIAKYGKKGQNGAVEITYIGASDEKEPNYYNRLNKSGLNYSASNGMNFFAAAGEKEAGKK